MASNKVTPVNTVTVEARPLHGSSKAPATNGTQPAATTDIGAIAGDREPFFTTPWYSPGHRVRGMDQNKLFINENAVRARAGLLMGFAFIVITLLASLETPSEVVPFMAIPILLDVSACPLTDLAASLPAVVV